MSLLRTIDVELFSRVVREASVGRQSDDLCNCESVTPTFGCLVDKALFFYCNIAFEIKKRYPPFDHLVGGGSGFDNLMVMLAFRFDEVLGFVLPGPIFNLGLLVLSPFIVQPLADGTFASRRLDHWGSTISAFYLAYKRGAVKFYVLYSF
jgi:hypothetical protein